jgi:hypothetical protein
MLAHLRAIAVALLLIGLATRSVPAADLADSTTLAFTNERVRCTFDLRVLSSLPVDTLQALVFDYDNLCEFSKEVSVIRKLEAHADRYIVEFTIRYLFNEMVSTWLRQRHADGRITIDMLTTRQTLSFLPYVTSMHAGFTFVPRGEFTEIRFFQRMSLSSPIEWIHFQVVKRKLRGFARDFERFVRGHEEVVSAAQ